MNLPLFLPGMLSFLIICLAVLAGAAIAVFLLKYKFKYSVIRIILTVFVLVPVWPVTAYLIFYAASNAIGRAKVETQLAEMRAQGIPLDKESILPKMPEKDSDNGAYFYKAAFGLMKVSSSCDTISKISGEYTFSNITEWSEQDRKIVRQMLATEDIKLILNLFRQGAAKPYAVYERQYQGSGTLLPELNSQRELFRLIRIQSFCEGLDGKPESGYRLLCDGFKTINQFKSETFLIPQLVGIACTSINIIGMNELISRYGITEPSAQQLLVELEKLDFNQAMIHGLDGDIMIWRDDVFERFIRGEKVPCIDKLVGYPLSTDIRNMISYGSEIWPFFYQDYAYYLERMNKIISLCKKPYWTVENEMKELKNENKYLEYRLITKLLTNELVNIRIKTANIESEINAAKLTLALHIYKNEHGAFPDRLEQLAPEILKEIPVDPISGKPFEYQKTDGKFTLSSVWLKEKEQKRLDDAKRMKTNQATPK